jgi:hypothetical protein
MIEPVSRLTTHRAPCLAPSAFGSAACRVTSESAAQLRPVASSWPASTGEIAIRGAVSQAGAAAAAGHAAKKTRHFETAAISPTERRRLGFDRWSSETDLLRGRRINFCPTSADANEVMLLPVLCRRCSGNSRCSWDVATAHGFRREFRLSHGLSMAACLRTIGTTTRRSGECA